MTEKKTYIDDDGDALEIDAQFFKEAKRGRPTALNKKQPVTIRLPTEIIDYFKGDDPKGWQTRLNEFLIEHVEINSGTNNDTKPQKKRA